MVTDASRNTIENEIMAILNKWIESAGEVNVDGWFPFLSDAYKLGFFGNGEFLQTSAQVGDAYREAYIQLERQEQLQDLDVRLAVLSPTVVVGTSRNRTATYAKDGAVSRLYIARTWVFTKINGEWKIIHVHQFLGPVE